MKITMATRIIPTTNDILLGRGKTYHNHRGNQRFRAIIAVHIPKYSDEETTRKQKTRIVQSIVEDMYNDGCRFLKQDGKSTLWHDVEFHNAKKKVGHALRDATAEMHRSLKRASEMVSSSHSRRQIQTQERATTAPEPVESRSAMNVAIDLHESNKSDALSRKRMSSLPFQSNLKVDDCSSGESCESESGGLFPASEFFKYSDIEPISIANISLSSQPHYLSQHPHRTACCEEDERNDSSVGNNLLQNDEADFFSSELDMLNQASSVMKDDDRR
jgi:hypothetical protein